MPQAYFACKLSAALYLLLLLRKTAQENCAVLPSRPAWGAWIEIKYRRPKATSLLGRAPHGARGLKLRQQYASEVQTDVAPRMGRVD